MYGPRELLQLFPLEASNTPLYLPSLLALSLPTHPSASPHLAVLQVVKQAARSADQQVDSLDQALSLSTPVGTSHHQAMRLGVEAHQVSGNTVDLWAWSATGLCGHVAVWAHDWC
jgi:hypothetical protein